PCPGARPRCGVRADQYRDLARSTLGAAGLTARLLGAAGLTARLLGAVGLSALRGTVRRKVAPPVPGRARSPALITVPGAAARRSVDRRRSLLGGRPQAHRLRGDVSPTPALNMFSGSSCWKCSTIGSGAG